MTVVIGICVILFGLASYICLIRNHQVYNYRKHLLDHMLAVLQSRTAEAIQQVDEMLAVLNTVSYNQMVWKFWKPVHSFYKGTILEDV